MIIAQSLDTTEIAAPEETLTSWKSTVPLGIAT
jgi:hypothetical protein